MAEARRSRADVDLALQAADHHLLHTLPFRGLQLGRLREADRVENLEESTERSRVAVVRGGAQEQPMFKHRRNLPEHVAQIAVLAERRGHQVVALVDDKEIPRQVR
jgi:hypothetical protein